MSNSKVSATVQTTQQHPCKPELFTIAEIREHLPRYVERHQLHYSGDYLARNVAAIQFFLADFAAYREELRLPVRTPGHTAGGAIL